MRFKVVYINLIVLGVASAQLCRTPDQKNGICLDITLCEEINLDFFTGDLDQLRSYLRCSDSENDICCPKKQLQKQIPQRSPSQPRLNVLERTSEKRDIELNAKDCGVVPTLKKISNGNKTSIGEFPFMVLLQTKNQEREGVKCGGTLVTPRYVLTAAHCISQNLASVVVGENTLGENPDCEGLPNGTKRCAPPAKTLKIESAIIHHLYQQDQQAYDIGLLRLNASVSLDNKDYVNTICLPTTEYLKTQLAQNRFLVAGWGQTESRTWPKTLMKALISKQPLSFCRNVFPNARIPDNLICAGGENLVDTCLGDSGGPFFWVAKVHSGSRYVQFGITRNGYFGCGKEFQGITPPSTYTNVAAHIDWIERSMY